MNYITTVEASEKWGISQRRVALLCATDRIPHVVQKGRMWLIPENAKKPVDGRSVRYLGRKKK